MKNIIFGLTIILCVALLVFGKLQYDQKLSGIAQGAKETMNVSETSGSSLNQQENKYSETLKEIIRDIDPVLQEKIENSIEHNKSLRVALFGSNAMSAVEDTETPWAQLVIEELNNTYGEGLFDVTIFEVGNRATYEVLDAELHNDVAEFQPDVLLFEPLILNDNGNVTMDKTLPNVTTILTEIEAASPEVLIVLQPPNPIFRPNYYLQQVRELKAYAEENGFLYIDHWEEWPDINSEEIKDYIVDTRPNQKGHEVWASAIVDFFIGK